jgi:hypothetical protein
MASGRPRRPNDPSVMSSIESALQSTRRPGPVEFSWHWRWEIGILVATIALSALLAVSFGLIALAAAAGAGLAAVGTLLCWPPARSRITAYAWCVITPHRVRAGCANAWVQTRNGRLPFVLYTVPAAFGERVQLWCPAGITAPDLFAARQVLAAACWAAEVRVIPNPRRSHIVALEIIRNHYPERTEATPPSWPYTRPVEGDSPDDPQEPLIPGWWEEPTLVPDRLFRVSLRSPHPGRSRSEPTGRVVGRRR